MAKETVQFRVEKKDYQLLRRYAEKLNEGDGVTLMQAFKVLISDIDYIQCVKERDHQKYLSDRNKRAGMGV